MYKIIDNLKEICQRFDFNSLEAEIEALDELLKNKNTINIAVLGQFKAGKSSFINSLLKSNILPTGITPVTNVVTFIQYHKNNRIKIINTDNTQKQITVAELKEYISEENNSENIKNIAFASVESEALEQFSKLKLIDTPGLGSAYKHNSQTTLDWMPNIGYSIVLTPATQPLSENDLKLVEDTLKYCPEITIIISKIDLINDSDLPEIKAFVEKTLKNRFNKDFQIYFYSIKNENYRQKIVDELLIPLDKNFEHKQHNILNFKISSLQNQCTDFLNILLAASEKQKLGETKLKSQILDEKLNYEKIKKELMLIAQNYISGTRNTIEKHILKNYEQKIYRKLKQDFINKYFTWKGNLSQITQTYEKWLKKSIADEILIIEKDDKQFFDNILLEAVNHFETYSKSFKQRLSDNIFKILAVKISEQNLKIENNEIKTPNISISRSFDTHIDLLWFLFPMFLFKKFFFKFFLKQIPFEIEKNLYRTTSLLTNIINKQIKTAEQETIIYISNQLTNIEQILNNTTDNSEEIRQMIDKLALQYVS